MAATRLLERLSGHFTDAWGKRAAPDDVIEYDLKIETMPILHQDEDGDHECVGHVPGLAVYVVLACPESGQGTIATAYVMMPLHQVYKQSDAEFAANDIWDKLTAQRLGYSMGLLEAEHPDGE